VRWRGVKIALFQVLETEVGFYMAPLQESISLDNFIGLSPIVLILISIGNAKSCNLRIVEPIINLQQMYNLAAQNYT